MNAPSKTQTDSWDLRIQNTANALGISPDYVIEKLKEFGVTPDELGMQMLDDEEVTKFGDFINMFGKLPVGDPPGAHGRPLVDTPMGRLRMAFKFIRSSKKDEARLGVDARLVQLKELGYKVKLEDADAVTLLGNYRPELPQDPVTLALRKRFGDKKVVAFNDDGTVAVSESVAYIADLEQGFEAQAAIDVNGRLEPLYPVGVNPKADQLVDEDPLFEGKALRQGRSQVNHRNWTKVKPEERKFCRLAVKSGLVNVEDREAVLKLIERAESGLKALSEVYPEVDVEYRRLAKDDELPKLKVRLGSSSAKPNNPFGVNRRY